MDSSRVDRRRFLGYAAVATGGLLAGGLGHGRPAVAQAQFTEWGWPLPYEQISAKSKQWLQSKGWWPLNAGFIVMWSGEELLGSILMNEKLLEKRGLEMKWQTFVAAGFSNEAFIPGRPRRAGAARQQRADASAGHSHPWDHPRGARPARLAAQEPLRSQGSEGPQASGRRRDDHGLHEPFRLHRGLAPPRPQGESGLHAAQPAPRRAGHNAQGPRRDDHLGAARLQLHRGPQDESATRILEPLLPLQRLLLHAAGGRGERAGRGPGADRRVRRSHPVGQGEH